MTVQTELRRVVQTGNGATSTFYFNAPVLGLDDLDIYTVTTAGVQTLQTRGGAGTFDYTMTINASTKYATITLNNNLTNGFKVVILRSTAITQGVDYVEGDPFLAETHEGALDRLTIIATQLQEQLDRSVKVVETSTTTGIKIEELEADKILVVNSAADGLTMGPTLAEVDTVADAIADVQTVATNIASVTTVASDLNEAVSEINTVAVNITNVNNVGTYISNVNTVATDIANINTVASDLNEAVSEINTVGTNIANVNTVGTDITNVNTVASGISNVNTVATNIANVNTAATNIASINTNTTNIVAIQNASTNATNAASSASAASTSATNAASSASAASTSASNASTSATNASNSASTATTQATNAASSATASANSATSAAASAASAAALLDNFDDRYLGAKSSDPSLDNDGNALVTGALYFNTTDGVMKVYTASGWIAASSASVATLATFEFVATAGQTVFTGNDANGSSLSYVAPALIVTLNGVRLRPGDDYTATNGTSITLVSAAALNDELVVDAFGSFLVANTVDLSTAQTVGGLKTFSSDIVFNGNVGVGTSSPVAKLDVLRSSTSTSRFDAPQIQGINSGAATTNQSVDIAMRFQDGTYNGTGGISMVRESSTARSGALTFSPIASTGNGTERMRIASTGQLGVGITDPASYGSIASKSTVTLAGDSTYALSLNDATTLNKRMVLGYYATGATGNNGFGVIQSVYSGTAWTDLVLEPNGGNVFVGGDTIAGATGTIYSKTTAKVFVQWQGSNGTINQSKNVSSVSRTGTGSYTVAYSITFSTNYAIVLGGSRNNSLSDAFGVQYYGQTATQVNINTYIPAVNFTDAYTVDLVIFA